MGTRPRHRLFVETALVGGASVALRAEQAHRLLHVLRAGRGDAVALFNGKDGEWRAVLAEAGKRDATLVVEERLREQAMEPDLWLLFAPIKRGPVDLMVEKATELGVGELHPVWTRHTDVQRLNLDRLRAIAVEAAEQCGRLTVPTIHEPHTLDEIVAAWPSDRRLIVCDESGRGAPIAAKLSTLTDDRAAILVGPEGGFAESELDAVRALSFAVAVDLGPRILRAETAAIAALACYQAFCAGRSGVLVHQPK
jgi:16S rRNA (uracil1498-N3)-methyltransferase